ncbi:DUF397 domain-containing protein [Nocardiopsis dassonvillei]|uniref:DUF397 domain-containing protein n=1 Tax=Nocardiopsis dassonvillei TaxID=2014 RepID=UPI0020A3A24E|nr:DUF397 domain-containing protein [Nocardiopsis dassonvillei]MCP3013513.1 DUF397 domain-containing protein [Nocardiopsis dassonvillei]
MNEGWKKSTYSGSSSNCVEARTVDRVAELRDSQHPQDATLSLPASEWAALTRAARKTP